MEKPPWWVEGIRKQISIKKCYGISGGKRNKKKKQLQDPLWHNRFPDEVQNDCTPNRTPEEWHTEKNQLPPNYVNEPWSLWFSFESGAQATDIRRRGAAIRSLAEQHAHECYDLLNTYFALDTVLMRIHLSFMPHSNSTEQMLFVLTIPPQRTLGGVPLSGAHWPWPRPLLSEVEWLWPDGTQAAWSPIVQLSTILPLDKTNQESGI